MAATAQRIANVSITGMIHGQIADPCKPPMIDSGNLELRAMHPQSQQGVCADAIATLEGIDRDAVDDILK